MIFSFQHRLNLEKLSTFRIVHLEITGVAGGVPRRLLSDIFGVGDRLPVQPQLFPEQEPQTAPSTIPAPSPRAESSAGAPVWLQRMSLFVLVLFCVYLGVLVMVLPWWPRMWDQNMFIDARPLLASILHNGAVRGLISGLGALDIWIGISEAIHYRESRG